MNDLSNICRTCLCSNALNPIFRNISDHSSYSTAIYLTTGLKVEMNDGLPQKMCARCIGLLNTYLKFRKQCRASEKYLLEMKTRIGGAEFSIVSYKLNQWRHGNAEDSHEVEIKIQISSDDNNDEKSFMDLADNSNESHFENSSNEATSTEDKPQTTNIGEDEPANRKLNQQEMPLKCEDSLKVWGRLSEHNRKIKCEVCEDYVVQSKMNRHRVLMHGQKLARLDKSFETPTGEDTTTEIEIKSKLIITDNHLNDDESQLMETGDDRNGCDIGNISNDVETADRLFETKQSVKSQRVRCLLCQQELSVRSVDGHMTRRHPGLDDRKVSCELCEVYVLRSKMNRHRLMKHGLRGFGCGYCKLEFDNKESLLEHVPTCSAKKRKRKVQNSSREPVECDVCHKSMQKGSLRLHKEVKHAGLRPVCQHCGKRFGNKFRLSEHYRAKHGYEKFKCARCDFQSASTMAMRNHERLHSGEKPFVCESCGAKFHAAYLLAQHKQSHRAERLRKCELCPASFKSNNGLHMHKRTCHSAVLHRCTMCERAYSSRHYVVKHLRQVHQYRGPVPSLQQLPLQTDGA